MPDMQLQALPDDMSPEGDAPVGWQLKTLKPRHKSICALVAQGLPNKDVATMTGVHPAYITKLMQQPVCQRYIKEMSLVAGVQLEALTQKTVDTISEVMTTGNGTERLKAARLQAEMTGRVGSKAGYQGDSSPAEDRLNKLADRLTGLLTKAKQQEIDREEIQEGEFEDLSATRQRVGTAAQADGSGDISPGMQDS